MKKRALINLLAFLLIFLFAVSCAIPINDDSDEIVITGTVRIVGSAMFPSMVITDNNDCDWYVENEDKDKLSDLEQCEVKVRGKPEYEQLVISGEKMVVKHYL
ncbi:MAG: hypothetical protein FWD78_15825, partial [Treponema sp.]|nr:hypothetical protein [Treponema sp.]